MTNRLWDVPSTAIVIGKRIKIVGGRGSEVSMSIFVLSQKSNGEQGENPHVAPVAQSDRATDF